MWNYSDNKPIKNPGLGASGVLDNKGKQTSKTLFKRLVSTFSHPDFTVGSGISPDQPL